MKLIKIGMLAAAFFIFQGQCMNVNPRLEKAVGEATHSMTHTSVHILSDFVQINDTTSPESQALAAINCFVRMSALHIFVSKYEEDTGGFSKLFKDVGGSLKLMDMIAADNDKDPLSLEVRETNWINSAMILSGSTGGSNSDKFITQVIKSEREISDTCDKLKVFIESLIAPLRESKEQSVREAVVIYDTIKELKLQEDSI